MNGLASYIAAQSAMPFVWGANDCLTFANGASRAMTGVGFCDDWLDFDYSDPSEAIRKFKAEQKTSPFSSIIEATDARLTRLASYPAPRGSIVARATPHSVLGYIFGVSMGKHIVFMAENGLAYMEPDKTDIAWAVK